MEKLPSSCWGPFPSLFISIQRQADYLIWRKPAQKDFSGCVSVIYLDAERVVSETIGWKKLICLTEKKTKAQSAGALNDFDWQRANTKIWGLTLEKRDWFLPILSPKCTHVYVWKLSLLFFIWVNRFTLVSHPYGWITGPATPNVLLQASPCAQKITWTLMSFFLEHSVMQHYGRGQSRDRRCGSIPLIRLFLDWWFLGGVQSQVFNDVMKH